MDKISRTFKEYNVDVTVYNKNSKCLDIINENIYDINSTEKTMKYFSKKFSDIGEVVDVKFTGNDRNIKAVMDLNTFLSLATLKVI